MKARSLLRHPVLWVAVVLTALTALWLVLGAPVSLVTQIATYALYGAGVNLLVGYTGLVPFGASVFFGCASYAAAFILLGGAGNEFAALALSILFSILLGLAIGAVILRRKGLYFSLLTLAFSQIAVEIAFKWTSVTGGENGIQGIVRPNFTSDVSFHVFVVVTTVLAMWLMWLMWRLAHSPFGRVLQAVRDNEPRASSLGYNVYLVRLGSFTLMAAVVGYAGALLTLMLQGVYADNLSWQHAGDSLLMTVLGGVHLFLGPLWGAIAFIILENRLSALTESWWLIFAPVLILFALLSPEGMQGLTLRAMRRRRWTLTNNTIPPRPHAIVPYESVALAIDPTRPILKARRLSKNFGSLVTAKEIDFQIRPSMLHSIIGPNGAGKTTLFNMLSGVLPVSGGQILFEDEDITRLPVHVRARLGISRSFQILSIFPNLTVFENVRVAVQAQRHGLGGLFFDAYGLTGIIDRTWSILDAVGLTDLAADLSLQLSHGAKRLLEIAVTIAIDSKLLLLDEPLAGLAEADRIVVADLIKRLSEKHAVLLIEHDIDRVLAISDRISVLHQGRIIADGKPAEVAANPEVIAAYLGASKGSDWSAPPTVERLANASNRPLLDARGVAAGYSGGTVLSGINLLVHEGEAVALLGRNGVGKTTLLRALTGSLPSSAGTITFNGVTLNGLKPYQINRRGISLVPEGRRLFPNLTVMENLRLAMRPGGISIADVSPAVVNQVMEALVKLRGKVAMIVVEHHAETVLTIVDKAYVLVNGAVAFAGEAAKLAKDHALQAKLLGVVQDEDLTSFAREAIA